MLGCVNLAADCASASNLLINSSSVVNSSLNTFTATYLDEEADFYITGFDDKVNVTPSPSAKPSPSPTPTSVSYNASGVVHTGVGSNKALVIILFIISLSFGVILYLQGQD